MGLSLGAFWGISFRTFLGQVPKAFIIAELNDKESLVERSFHGPEILTALKPSQEGFLQGFSAAKFAANAPYPWPRH